MVHYQATQQRTTKWLFYKIINLDRAKSHIGKGQFDYFVEQSEQYQQASDDQAKDKLK